MHKYIKSWKDREKKKNDQGKENEISHWPCVIASFNMNKYKAPILVVLTLMNIGEWKWHNGNGRDDRHEANDEWQQS